MHIAQWDQWPHTVGGKLDNLAYDDDDDNDDDDEDDNDDDDDDDDDDDTARQVHKFA